jgi:hypothetical protein
VKNPTRDIDAVILEGRAAGLTLAAIGKSVGMTRQGVHARIQALLARPRRRQDDAIVEMLQRTNRLLAGVIVRICAMQTTRADYPIEVLTALGLSAREVAGVIGSTEASVNVTKARARKKAASPQAEESIQ